MNDDLAHKDNPITLARASLASVGDLQVLKTYRFRDDEDAHDDMRQRDLERMFDSAFFDAVKQLETAFGAARIGSSADVDDVIPLCGVFRAAFWEIDDNTLFVSASHEDRETPFLLMVGAV